MDTNIVIQFISTVGFPIAACVMMYREQVKTRKAHEDEAKLWADALNNNTRVLERLEVMMSGVLNSNKQ